MFSLVKKKKSKVVNRKKAKPKATPNRKRPKRVAAFSLPETSRLLDVVHQLRTRCPWDKEQTHRSLIPYFLEETYEAVDAIEGNSPEALREELGDVLLQVTLHAEIAGENEGFDFEMVAKGIADKMIRRHPHVFADQKTTDAKTHAKRWTELKSKEKPKRFLLAGIPRAMPALALSQRYGEIAASVGFDWSHPSQVMEKVMEEWGELKEALAKKKPNRNEVELELGDLLFTLANLARHLKLDAEAALRASAGKFHDRFTQVEKGKRDEGKHLGECSVQELEAAWEAVKAQS